NSDGEAASPPLVLHSRLTPPPPPFAPPGASRIVPANASRNRATARTPGGAGGAVYSGRHGGPIVRGRVPLLPGQAHDRRRAEGDRRARGAAPPALDGGSRRRLRSAEIEIRGARRALQAADASRSSEGQGPRPEVPGEPEESQGLARPAAAPL